MHLRQKLLQVIKQSNFFKNIHSAAGMACSRYEYVKTYERDESILPNVFIVVRVDGKGFTKFCQAHNFQKPNDPNALNLMNTAAIAVMQEFNDVFIAYGQSDEYSFVFRKDTSVYKRRASKLLSYVCSLFTSAYVLHWSECMQQKLQYAPCFDARIVLYPTEQNLRDYLSWRQADVHINNLYNTAFWCLVLQEGKSNQQAEAELRGTVSAEKNELLFARFNINYNNLPVMFRKGTTLLRKRLLLAGVNYKQPIILPTHTDMIREKFWQEHSELLAAGGKTGTVEIEENALPDLLLKQVEKLKI